MEELEGEIEYLEEDAELVQKCISYVNTHKQKIQPKNFQNPSLIARPANRSKRKKGNDSDYDYDPSEEDGTSSPEIPKKQLTKKVKISSMKVLPDLNQVKKLEVPVNKEEYTFRKHRNIRIPDFEDPLCLPVKASKNESVDKKRLNSWNNACIDHFKQIESTLKPQKDITKKTIKTATFKNTVNKVTGNTETTIWSKTCVETDKGDMKTDIFQNVLPRYNERKSVTKYVLGKKIAAKQRKSGTVIEVVLSKEEHKDGDRLVVHKPGESVSAVYEFVDKSNIPDEQRDESTKNECKKFIRELTCCKICASCFQSSWRPIKSIVKKSLSCPICLKTFVTPYNLLSHFKMHMNTELRKFRPIISNILAEVVGYHYQCRVCSLACGSLRNIRQHVDSHQSTDTFTCEVCNKVVNEN